MNNEDRSAECKYPADMNCYIKQSKDKTTTLSIAPAISRSRIADGDSPLKVFNDFSRFVFTIIEKSETLSVTTFNLKVGPEYSGFFNEVDSALSTNCLLQDMMRLEEKLDQVLNEIRNGGKTQEETAALSEAESKAYTLKFIAGEFKGKSPAEVLLENPGNLEKLKRQYAFLKENLARYPKNKELMDAIGVASTMLQYGKLEANNRIAPASASGTDKTKPLWESSPKVNIYKKGEDGYAPCSLMRVTYDPVKDYPFNLEIENSEVPVKEYANGKINGVASSSRNFKKNSIRLDKASMRDLILSMERYLSSFEGLSLAKCIEEAEKEIKKRSLKSHGETA